MKRISFIPRNNTTFALTSVSYSYTLAIQFDNWTNTISLPKFDPSLGVLWRVTLTLACTSRTISRVENLDAVARTGVQSGANFSKVIKNDLNEVLFSDDSLQVLFTNNLGAYDGLGEFGGSSGVSNARRASTRSIFKSMGRPFDEFIGTGNKSFTIESSAMGFCIGPTNFLLQVLPESGLTFTVTYYYFVTTNPLSTGISGTVWHDYNGNGVQEPGEIGFEGVTLTLLDEFGMPVSGVSPVLTDVDGYYEFTGIAAGNYYVVYEMPVGYTATYDVDGVDGSNSMYLNVTNNNITISSNVGLAVLTSTVYGYLYDDLDANGVVDGGDSPMEGIVMELWDETETTLLSTVNTDVTGGYSFSSLTAGNYVLKYYPPPGYYATYDADGVDANNKITLAINPGETFELYILLSSA